MNIVRLAGASIRVLRTEGLKSFLYRVRKTLSLRVTGQPLHMAVKTEDAVSVDWTKPPSHLLDPITVTEGASTIAWIMSPPGESSGGHQNLYRFIDFAERAGHRCIVYFYSQVPMHLNPEKLRASLRSSSSFADIKAELSIYDPAIGVDPSAHAIFATGWETAYPVYLDPSRARRFYFVQDYEPAFYPVGSESILAENTYRFGFHPITAGGWLPHKLKSEFGVDADHFDFAVEPSNYSLLNTERRHEIFFYARPVTPRRGFELGILALQEFAARRPDVPINLAGWDVSRWKIPFKHKNLSGMPVGELNQVYNRCAAGLVISGTNMSLLPLELMASGVVPVVNDAPNNRMVSDNPFIEYVPSSPVAIAERLIEALERPDAADHLVQMAASLDGVTWDASGSQFVMAFERAMRG